MTFEKHDDGGESLVLVDEAGREIGASTKRRAHSGAGLLHLAFSIVVFNAAGELLLQRRADGKYHFAGLWSNTCCGHPRPGEDVLAGGTRRLQEEFGLDVVLRPRGSFRYRARDRVSGLIEHEFVHVLSGLTADPPRPAPHEIGAWDWRRPADVREDLGREPEGYTPWLARVLQTLEPS